MADRARLDILVREGRPRLPVCILIHGLGMSKRIWTDPERERIMGGLFPLKTLLKGYDELKTLYHDLTDAGFPVIAWSQRRPVGPADAAVEELREVAGIAGELNNSGAVLIGHSRGGLVARSWITGAMSGGGDNPPGFAPKDEASSYSLPLQVRGLITLCTPHMGSGLARWSELLNPLAASLNRLVPENEHGVLASAVKRAAMYAESRGVRELLPGSAFLASLSRFAPPGAYCLSLGGTDPALIRIPGIMPLPGGIENLLSMKVLPEEMRSGRGDGLVSARSSVMPFAREHLDFPVHHAAIVVDPAARRAVMDRITRYCT